LLFNYNSSNINSNWGAGHAADSLSPTWCLCSGRAPAYLSQKLTRPIPTKDGGTLRTVLDAARAADFSRQVELALFMDAKLDVSKLPAE
jgi:hypothetical protein